MRRIHTTILARLQKIDQMKTDFTRLLFVSIILMICFVSSPGVAFSDDKLIVLDQLLSGMKTCSFDHLYFDTASNRPANKQVENTGLKNPKIVEGLAIYYNVHATYLGMPVTAFWIPSTFDAVGVEISMEYSQARKVIQKNFGRDFFDKASGTEMNSTFPELRVHSKDNSKSIFECYFE